MTSRLSVRERRVLAIAGLGLLPLFALVYAAPSVIRDHRLRRSVFDQESDLLSRELALVREHRATRQLLARDAAAMSRITQSATLRAANTETAYSELSERLRGVSRSLDVAVLSIAPLPSAESAPGLRLLRAALRLECDVGGLERLLQAIAADPLLVRITSLRVERIEQGSSEPLTATRRQVVQVSVVLEALASLAVENAGGAR